MMMMMMIECCWTHTHIFHFFPFRWWWWWITHEWMNEYWEPRTFWTGLKKFFFSLLSRKKIFVSFRFFSFRHLNTIRLKWNHKKNKQENEIKSQSIGWWWWWWWNPFWSNKTRFRYTSDSICIYTNTFGYWTISLFFWMIFVNLIWLNLKNWINFHSFFFKIVDWISIVIVVVVFGRFESILMMMMMMRRQPVSCFWNFIHQSLFHRLNKIVKMMETKENKTKSNQTKKKKNQSIDWSIDLMIINSIIYY